MIVVENHKKKMETLRALYPGAIILDVTSHAEGALRKLSPFYPHGDIPVPYSDGYTAASVEGIWQGLKVFEHADISLGTMQNSTMQNLKRTVRKYGKPLGHRKGIHGTELLGYLEARHQIYLPAYQWVLENKCLPLIDIIRREAAQKTVVLRDYETNSDVDNPQKPLSHAALIKAYCEGNYPN